MRSVKRIAGQVAKNDSQRQAFKCLAYNIRKMERKEDVTMLFDALQGPKHCKKLCWYSQLKSCFWRNWITQNGPLQQLGVNCGKDQV